MIFLRNNIVLNSQLYVYYYDNFFMLNEIDLRKIFLIIVLKNIWMVRTILKLIFHVYMRGKAFNVVYIYIERERLRCSGESCDWERYILQWKKREGKKREGIIECGPICLAIGRIYCYCLREILSGQHGLVKISTRESGFCCKHSFLSSSFDF